MRRAVNATLDRLEAVNRRETDRATRLAVAVLIASAASNLIVSSAGATPPGANGRIAFGSDLVPGPVATSGAAGSLETDVNTILPDGTARTRLTSTPGPDAIAAWSPDGSKIAFASGRDGNQEIYVIDADGANPQRLTSHPAGDGQPRWSPDGSKLVFQSLRTGNPELFLMSADGTGVEQLTNHPAVDSWPEFSPDGTKIAFTSSRSGFSAVYVMKTDGTDIVQVTPDSMAAGQPDWSPDGSRLVFANNLCQECPPGRPHSDLFVLTIGTGATERLTKQFGNNLNPSWSPDGSSIAFWHGSGLNPGVNNTDVFVIGANGLGVINVTNTPSLREFVPDWGPAAP